MNMNMEDIIITMEEEGEAAAEAEEAAGGNDRGEQGGRSSLHPLVKGYDAGWLK
jgi:hypothetical protein